MKRAAVLFAIALALPFIPLLAQAQQQQDEPEQKAQDSGIRKLSRRERKERIKALAEKYREFLQEVEPIILPQEIDAFLVLESDAQRDVYIDDFWKRRDQATGKTGMAYRDLYYIRLDEAKTRYKSVASDQSKIFLIHGEPDEVLEIQCKAQYQLLQPIELWTYAYIEGFGRPATLLFYQPRRSVNFRLWQPMGSQQDDYYELISEEVAAVYKSQESAVHLVFYETAGIPGHAFVSKIETWCNEGRRVLTAIELQRSRPTDLPRLFNPPEIEKEDIGRILRTAVIATPNAGKLTAEFSVKYPAKRGSRTDAEMTVLIPRSQLKATAVGDVTTYSINVTGEILKEDNLFENFRYRFDFPADVKDEKLPLVIERFLMPAEYKARLKIVDVHTGAEVIVENEIDVPDLFDPSKLGAKPVRALRDEIESDETKLRIIPMADELLSGYQQIETMAVGEDIKAVEFYLDGKKIAVKRAPPYTFNLDFGTMPMARRIRAVALNAKNEIVAGDEVVVNTGTDPFRVRIVSPRIAMNLHGKTRVEMDVHVPEGRELAELQLFLNDIKVATLFGPPYVQTIDVPYKDGVSYIRAVATMKDEEAPVEDLVMLNTPQFMEEVNVHLVELPTTVLVNGKHKNDLSQEAFRILDEGEPVKVSKFEYVKNLPLSIGITMDTSGSMLPRMDEAQKTASKFLKNVMKTGDRAFLVAFDSEVQTVQKWTPRLTDVNAGLSKLRAEEYTALYDAIVFSLYNFFGVRGQKALVLITDGKDTRSKFSFDQALEYARRAAVPIYAIGIAIRSAEFDVRYKLSKLASETGGNTYYIDRADELSRIYEDIQNELRSQYVIGFYPPQGVKSGSKWREVSVEVSEGKAKTIRGYYP